MSRSSSADVASAPPGPWLAVALGCAVGVWLVAQGAVHASVTPLLSFTLSFTAVSVEIVVLASLAPVLSRNLAMLAVGLSLLALAALGQLGSSAVSAALLTLVLGLGATALGAAVGGRIDKLGQLAAVALVSAIADLWSVFDKSAPSARFAEEVMARPEELALFALPFPLLGTALIPAVIGAGDIVFAALYVAAFRAHGRSVARVTFALGLGFLLGLLGLLVTERPLPLLPLLGAAVVLSDPAARSLTAREWRTVLGVCAALLAAIALRILSTSPR